MEEQMTVEAYLAQGGVVTSPVNVGSRYRAEVLKIMATFVDSSLAGAAGFADTINAAPGLRERIAAARIVLEKTQNAERVLGLMGEFGANSERYADSQPWSARLPRSAPSDAVRSEHDMRLSVFNFPLEGWTDAVVMNVVMGHAVVVQMSDLVRVSYQPLAIAFREISEVESRHARIGEQGLGELVSSGKTESIEVSLAYWYPRVSDVFVEQGQERFEHLRSLGLRHQMSADLREKWKSSLSSALDRLGVEWRP